jgi:hypothetical protein
MKAAYYAACEAGRLQKNYEPLEWEPLTPYCGTMAC